MNARLALFRFLLRDLNGSRHQRTLWVFAACLFLGITLVGACGGLLQLVRGGLASEERALFGGDLVLQDRAPLDAATLDWLNARAEVSRLVELRTMVGSAEGEATVAELQSVDARYPLYGTVRLSPDLSLDEAVRPDAAGRFGAAFDPVLAEQLDLAVGQTVTIGSLEVELRAEIVEQPDRSLRADVRGPPVLVDAEALAESGLLMPGSLVDYEYRIRTEEPADTWRESLRAAFPDAPWEVRSVEERTDFIAERLNQIGSVLLLVSFSTLFIGGLGVSNSVAAYLQSKLGTLATLQSLGLRGGSVVQLYLGQVLVLATLASAAGALAGIAIAGGIGLALAERVPIAPLAPSLLPAAAVATLFGIATALVFALPTLGRTLALSPARLIAGHAIGRATLTRRWRIGTGILALVTVVLLLVLIPDRLVGIAFVVAIGVLFLLLDGIERGLRRVAQALGDRLHGHFAWRLAVAGIARPGSPLRALLLSLGTALTLLVASAIVIAATVRTLGETVPSRAPSLVFYDIPSDQLDEFRDAVSGLDGFREVQTAPFVLGRLVEVNGEALSASDDAERALEANDEHKLSYRLPGIDNTEVARGAWWAREHDGPAEVAMEDREAEQLGLEIGDRLRFSILDQPLEAELVAIYAQARFETRFWFEAVFTDGALEPFVTRHVGNAWFEAGTDLEATAALGQRYPNVVTVRTAKILEAARAVLTQASLGVLLIAAVSLAASLLVMASVVAVNRQRQAYEASVLHALGTRMADVLKSVVYEYVVLAVVLTVFASVVGSLIAAGVLTFWLELPAGGLWSVGVTIAAVASAACLAGGAWWLSRTLRVAPAVLLSRGS